MKMELHYGMEPSTLILSGADRKLHNDHREILYGFSMEINIQFKLLSMDIVHK